MVTNKPNIVFVYADDLGRGMLSCYGQTWFRTPNIDRIAEEGMKLMRAYGCAFCAPARASLLTGYHDCHAGTWSYTQAGIYEMLGVDGIELSDITELINNTGFTARPNEVYLPEMLRNAGYITGQVGKLEWGFATTPQDLERHGWEYHYGYYDHVMCHGYYPPFVFENGNVLNIPGNTRRDCGKHPGVGDENRAIRHDRTGKAVYSQDLFDQKLVQFIEDNKDRPFFLYHPSQLPHGGVSIPEIHPSVLHVEGLTEFEKEYASMVLRLDETVGLIEKELKRHGLYENTLFIFCADNGHGPHYHNTQEAMLKRTSYDNITHRFTTEDYGDVFNGNDGMAGCKFTNWEGGTRIPYLVRWPGRIAAGTVTNQLIANYDLMPTLAEAADADMPYWKDGISFLPTLLGLQREQRQHEHIVYASRMGPALVTEDGWKLRHVKQTGAFQLYYLPEDYKEERDLSTEKPDKVRELLTRLLRECDGNLEYGTPELHRARYPQQLLGEEIPGLS